MELIELQREQEQITCLIFQEREEGRQLSSLPERIKKYKEMVRDYAAQLRSRKELYHKGEQILTKPAFRRACVREGWWNLIDDAEGKYDA